MLSRRGFLAGTAAVGLSAAAGAADGGDEPRSIVDAGTLLRHVHIADYRTRMFPGFDQRETWRLKPFFTALKAIGYTGGVSCECSWGDAKDFAKNAKTAIETMKGLV